MPTARHVHEDVIQIVQGFGVSNKQGRHTRLIFEIQKQQAQGHQRLPYIPVKSSIEQQKKQKRGGKTWSLEGFEAAVAGRMVC